MTKAKKAVKKEQPKNYKEKVAIKGDFLEVFKVVKQQKEQKSKEDKKNG